MVHLAVVALDEEREGVALAERGGDHHRHVLGRPLLGIGDLRAGDLQDDGAGLAGPRGAEDRPGRVVGEHAHVDGRHGEATTLAPSPGQVQIIDGGGTGPGHLAQLPEEPAGRLALISGAEHRLPDQPVGRR